MPPSGNVSIEVFYQPVSPNSDDFTDVLKDKFLITMFMDSAEETYKTDIKDKKPSYQHRLKASVKKSLLKSSPERREVPAVDKDKDVYLKEVRTNNECKLQSGTYENALSAQSSRPEAATDERGTESGFVLHTPNIGIDFGGTCIFVVERGLCTNL